MTPQISSASLTVLWHHNDTSTGTHPRKSSNSTRVRLPNLDAAADDGEKKAKIELARTTETKRVKRECVAKVQAAY